MKKLFLLALLFLLLFLGSRPRPVMGQEIAPENNPDPATAELFAAFATELETLRQELNIPGWSAAIVQDQQLVWAQGFGYADVDGQIPATPDTPYHLASVTKPIAATLLMQLVEEGSLSLDDPVTDYGVDFMGPEVTVWHLLTHTSAGVPGTSHDYDGHRYSYLTDVIAGAGGQSFGRLLQERFLDPLAMTHTAANPSWQSAGVEGFFAALGLPGRYQQYPGVYRALARPYQFDETYQNVPGSYSLHFSPAAGLISSVTDLARFDIALDQDQLLRPETKAQMFTPARNNAGEPLIYGLGWYTQEYAGTPILWHSGGWGPSVSARLVKFPEYNLTFILLANNYNLTRPYPLGDGDVLYATPALLFYQHFIFPRQFGQTVPDIDWAASGGDLVRRLDAVTDPDVRAILERELWSYRMLYASTGRFSLAERLGAIHRRAFPEFLDHRQSSTATSANGVQGPAEPTALRPEAVVWSGWFLLAWPGLSALSFLVLFGLLWRTSFLPYLIRGAWLIAALVFGPLALLAYLLSDSRRPRTAPQPAGLRALGPALFQAAGQIILLALTTMTIIFRDPESNNLAAYLVSVLFLGGWLLFRTLPDVLLTGRNPARRLLANLPAGLLTTVLVLAGALPLLIWVTDRLFIDTWPGSPIFWLGLLPAAFVAALLLYPLEWFLVRRQWEFWSYAREPAEPIIPDTPPRPKPA